MSLFSISGPGSGLPLPVGAGQYLNPGYPQSGVGPNSIGLPSGASYLLPSGTFLVIAGATSTLQFLDPIKGVWTNLASSSVNGEFVNSDGSNYRLINTVALPTSATITAAGTGYTSEPIVTPSAGSSMWQAVVGGALNIAIGSGGSGYQAVPIVLIDAPPAGGVQATAYATLTNGVVTAITRLNNGAGYASPPNVYIVPSSTDPSINIVNATAVATLTGAGTITAVLLQNPGMPITAVPTLTFTGGGGASAAATVVTNTTTAGTDTVTIQPV
jgi:hypothetical protein